MAPIPTRCRRFSLEAILILFSGVALAGATSAKEISVEQLETLPSVDVLILGEVHDNPQHHVNQAAAIRSTEPVAVVFEMLDAAQADIVNERTRTGLPLGDALNWIESGWPPFKIYLPVFEAASTARVYGMAVPKPQVATAFIDGAAAAFEGDAARFDLDAPLDPAEQDAREQMQMDAHCNALPASAAGQLVAAQRLRDAAFARTILRALDETGGPVAVITGSGHARTDWGVPALLRAADPSVSTLSIGQIEETGEPTDGDLPFDMWLLTAEAPRQDPCAMVATPGQKG